MQDFGILTGIFCRTLFRVAFLCYFKLASIDSIHFLPALCLTGLSCDANIEISGVKIIRVADRQADTLKRCDVLIEIKNETSLVPQSCPGRCFPIPRGAISCGDLDDIARNQSKILVTCSQASGIFIESNAVLSNDQRISQILKIIFYRRIMECREKMNWPHVIGDDFAAIRRRIGGLFIWAGTEADMMTLQLQRSVLYQSNAVLGSETLAWLATESTYPCSTRSTLCKAADPVTRYYSKYMPPTGKP